MAFEATKRELGELYTFFRLRMEKFSGVLRRHRKMIESVGPLR